MISDDCIGAIQRLVFDSPGITVSQVSDRLDRRYSSLKVLFEIKQLTSGPVAVFSRDEADRLHIKEGTENKGVEARTRNRRKTK